MTGFIQKLFGLNPREEDLFKISKLYTFHITYLRQNRIQTSIIKTFKNDKRCKDNKQTSNSSSKTRGAAALALELLARIS